METLLGTSFFTEDKVVAQADTKVLVSNNESLIVKFNQEKFEELFSSGSISPKAIRKLRKVSNKSCSQASSLEDSRSHGLTPFGVRKTHGQISQE